MLECACAAPGTADGEQRRPALDALDQPVDAVLRIAADKQMDVVWHDFHFNQRRLRLVAYLLN
jgi:hypothetical protein